MNQVLAIIHQQDQHQDQQQVQQHETQEPTETEEHLEFQGRWLNEMQLHQDNAFLKEAEFQSRIDSVSLKGAPISDIKSLTERKVGILPSSVFNNRRKKIFLDVLDHENGQSKMTDEEKEAIESDSKSIDETQFYLGESPSQDSQELKLMRNLINRLKFWMKEGIGKEEDRDKLLSTILRKGEINFEAPSLNEELAMDLHPKSFARDEHFRIFVW